MTIHTIEPDFKYQSLGSRDYVRRYTGRTAGMSLAEGWTKLLFFPIDPTLPRGDFLNVKGYVLACSERTVIRLSPLLERSGELLPIQLEGASEPYLLWNLLRSVDALDEAQSNCRGVRPQDAKYAFYADGLPREPQIFRASSLTSVFSLGVGDQLDFASRYQSLGLTGLVLRKVWESS